MKFAMKRCMDGLDRIVLPKDMRDHYGIQAGDELEIIATEEGILLKISSIKKKKEDLFNTATDA